MSDVPADLDMRATLARIDRDLAESRKLREEGDKLVAEKRKLIAEDLTLAAEQRKLIAEARKLDRDWWLTPWSLVIALATGVGLGVVQLAAHLLGWWR